MYRIAIDYKSSIKFDGNLDEVKKNLANSDTLIWLDFEGESINDSRQILSEIFKFHHLAIDDALIETHNPKIDDWEDYLYITLASVNPKQILEDIDKSIELDVFLGKRYLVSFHTEKMHAIDVVWDNLKKDERRMQRGINFILYQIVDELSNEYMAMIDHLDMKVEQVEGMVMEKPDRSLLEEIFQIRRSLMNLRRIVAPQREVLNKLSRGYFRVIDSKEQMYYRDVYDHLVRIHDITESLRDLVSGALETYLSVVNNRLNDIMKALTLITTLFMPLSFLTGFFGMNFFSAGSALKEWTGTSVFFGVTAIIVGLPLAMYLWMRKREWM